MSIDQTENLAKLSLAERMWRRNRDQTTSESSETSEAQTAELTESEDELPEIYRRVDHVLNGLQSLLPSNMAGSPQAAILTEIMRGMRRDISLVPEDQVQQFMHSIGEACLWIAEGLMEDLEDAGIRSDSSEEG